MPDSLRCSSIASKIFWQSENIFGRPRYSRCTYRILDSFHKLSGISKNSWCISESFKVFQKFLVHSICSDSRCIQCHVIIFCVHERRSSTKCTIFGNVILHGAYHGEVVTASRCWYHVLTKSADANRLLPAGLHLSRGDSRCYLRIRKKNLNCKFGLPERNNSTG